MGNSTKSLRFSSEPSTNASMAIRQTTMVERTDTDADASQETPSAQDVQALKQENARLTRDLDKLTTYMDDLHYRIQMVEESSAWRIGYRVMTLAKRLLGRKIGASVFDDIHKTLRIYHHWKKARD